MAIPKRRRVFFLDMENTEDDLRERLTSFGITDQDALEQFVLVSLPPDMQKLDTPRGGRELVEAVQAYGLVRGDVVVLDSYQRVTGGPENDSDTARSFYTNTALRLKALGLTVIRTDNTGKDPSKRARGSSGKRDDVDVEFVLQSRGENIEIEKAKARQRGVGKLSIAVLIDDGGRTTFRSDLPTPTGRKVDECVALLDKLGLPPKAGERTARPALREAGHEVVREVVRQACRRRQERTADFAEPPS